MAQSAIPEIETDRLILRQATAEHLDEWAAQIFADPEVMRYLPKRDMAPYARAERALNNYGRLWAERNLGGWVVVEKDTDSLIGHCHVMYLNDTDEYELGYSLSKSCWGRGFATEAARAATRFSFESRGLKRIMAVTLPENLPSRRVLERVGFIYEKDAHYYDLDVVYYALPRERFHTGNSAYRAYE